MRNTWRGIAREIGTYQEGKAPILVPTASRILAAFSSESGSSADRHDSPLLAETLDTVKTLGPLPERTSVHLERGYDSDLTRKRLEERGLIDVICEKGKPAPLQATKRWVVEGTNSSWQNAHKKLVWCTERRVRVIDFWVAFSNAIVIVGRLIREAWTHYYRWESRPATVQQRREASAK